MLNSIIFESYIQTNIQNEGIDLDLNSLINTLQSMAVFCAQNVDWTGTEVDLAVREPLLLAELNVPESFFRVGLS
jgi:hypothetical protein